MTDLTVVGLGYIGLPTAALFAGGGFSVHGVDVDVQAIETINEGRAHFVEPGLDDLVQEVVATGRLVASTTYPAEGSSAYIVAVPTPFKEGKQPDLRFVKAAGEALAVGLRAGALVVLESTSPIGATEKLAQWIAAARPDLKIAGVTTDPPDVHIAYCPERVLPGNILTELVHNDRLVGGVTPACAERAAELYAQVVEGDCCLTGARTAEMAKLTENAFRDVNIAFANELSVIADEMSVDVWELIELANLHPRVNVLQPGAGVGGHCIAVDPWFLVAASDQARLIECARTINDDKPRLVVGQVLEAIAHLDSPTIACLGLAYKPDIDDLRESPAIEVVRQLRAAVDVPILVVEPNIDTVPSQLADLKVELSSLDDALGQADVLVGLVAHRDVLKLDSKSIERHVLVDPAGVFRAKE